VGKLVCEIYSDFINIWMNKIGDEGGSDGSPDFRKYGYNTLHFNGKKLDKIPIQDYNCIDENFKRIT